MAHEIAVERATGTTGRGVFDNTAGRGRHSAVASSVVGAAQHEAGLCKIEFISAALHLRSLQIDADEVQYLGMRFSRKALTPSWKSALART